LRRAAVDHFTERWLDINRTIGQPKKITLIFGRKVTKLYIAAKAPPPIGNQVIPFCTVGAAKRFSNPRKLLSNPYQTLPCWPQRVAQFCSESEMINQFALTSQIKPWRQSICDRGWDLTTKYVG
jgi:hypothetical protein